MDEVAVPRPLMRFDKRWKGMFTGLNRSFIVAPRRFCDIVTSISQTGEESQSISVDSLFAPSSADVMDSSLCYSNSLRSLRWRFRDREPRGCSRRCQND
jgi:hypothetical protein